MSAVHSGPVESVDDARSNADVIRRLTAGYAHVDALLGERREIFAYGETQSLVEMNHLVLCGTDPERRQQFASHIAATERRFYEAEAGGIGEALDWQRRNATGPVERVAAGLFVQIVSTPQLFLEGNRRTACLAASYWLARSGRPPLVVPAARFLHFEALANACAKVTRAGVAGAIGRTIAAARIASFISETSDTALLRREIPSKA